MESQLNIVFERVLNSISQLTVAQVVSVNNYESENLSGTSRKFSVLFPAGFLLHSLSFVPETYGQVIMKQKIQLIDFLNSEMDKFSYNYFTNEFTKTHPALRLPNDVDDTVLILSALLRNKQHIDERTIIGLINLEIKPGGPYKTWYVGGKDNRWHDIDPFVNAHILYFVSLLRINLALTREYVLQQLKSDQANSPYYPYRLFFYMNIAKYCILKADIEIRSELEKRLATITFNSLLPSEKLLYLVCKSTLVMDLSNSENDYLLNLPNSDFTFPETIACYDFAQKSKMTFTASSVFTASLWIEIVSQLLNKQAKLHKKSDSKTIAYFCECQKVVNKSIPAAFAQEVKGSFPFEETSIPLLLPVFITEGIQPNIKNEPFINISAAAYLGWVGFTKIDELVDSGFGFRKALKWYEVVERGLELLKSERILGNNKMFHAKLKRLSCETLSWYKFESENRLNNINEGDTKVYTSGYHIIKKTRPFIYLLSIIPALLNNSDLTEVTQKLLTAIMIIRQLGDDAHDWKQDIAEGTPTIATVQLKGKNPESQETVEYFWQHISPQVTKKCDYYYKRAAKMISNQPKLKTLEPFLKKAYGPIIELKRELKGIKKILRYYSK